MLLSESDRIYFDKLMETPVLPQHKVLELSAIIRSGGANANRAKQKLVRHNMKLVANIAARYAQFRHSMTFMDLIQEGSIGLQVACERFDPQKGYQFSTYAYWWIRQYIRRSIQQKDRLVRLPEHYLDEVSKISATLEDETKRTGRLPTAHKVAEILGTTPTRVLYRMRSARKPYSLNRLKTLRDGGGSEYMDYIKDLTQSPEDFVDQRLLQEYIHDEVSKLTPTQQEALVLHYGLDGREPLTFREISQRRGRVPQASAICQQRALKTLKKRIRWG